MSRLMGVQSVARAAADIVLKEVRGEVARKRWDRLDQIGYQITQSSRLDTDLYILVYATDSSTSERMEIQAGNICNLSLIQVNPISLLDYFVTKITEIVVRALLILQARALLNGPTPDRDVRIEDNLWVTAYQHGEHGSSITLGPHVDEDRIYNIPQSILDQYGGLKKLVNHEG